LHLGASFSGSPAVREQLGPKPSFQHAVIIELSLMFYVYILTDDDSKIYVGYSNNLRRRIVEHKNGKTYTTLRMKNPKLVYYEAYETENKAKIRERKLKQYGSSYQGLLKRIGLKT
jgi:putative endonuclease